MKLTRVTITGADDGVDPKALCDLSAEFPFVEWGILYSYERAGEPRYPSYHWRYSFAVLLDDRDDVSTALHLCGPASREVIAGEDALPCLFNYDRVQLNGFSRYKLPLLRVARRRKDHEFILQCQSSDALEHAAELARQHPNVSALWDCSGGTGKLIDVREAPMRFGDLRIGYAGGLAPDNLAEFLPVLHALRRDSVDVWIDLESGIRTNDRFDLVKVRRALELAKSFVSEVSRGCG